MPQAKILMQKVSTKSVKRQPKSQSAQEERLVQGFTNHLAKKPYKPNPQQGQLHRQGQKPQKPKSEPSVGLSMCKHCGDTRHRPGFNCPATKCQCKKCQNYGHFTSKCLTKAQNTNVNTVEEVNAIHAFSESPHHLQAELLDNDSFDVMYICTICNILDLCIYNYQLNIRNLNRNKFKIMKTLWKRENRLKNRFNWCWFHW